MASNSKRRGRTLAVWSLLCLFLCGLVWFQNSNKPRRFEEYETFRDDVTSGNVAEVRVEGSRIFVTTHDGLKYHTVGVVDPESTVELSRQGVPFRYGSENGYFATLTPWLVGAVIAIIVLVFLLRRSKGGTNNIFTFRKSRARVIPETGKVTFAAVAGCDEAKELLGDLVDFLKNPWRWANAGVRLPRGVLLEGPPGCGKTLLARAVAGETNANFYLAAASEFVEMFVGVGAARVRDAFETAVKNAPAVLFIDELDAIGRRRGSGVGWGNDEREQTLNQLLICIDGFESTQPVVIIAATNRPDVLDPALVRPGRFDRRIRIPPLSNVARLEALRIHTRNKNLSPEVSLDDLVERTEGWTGAQLENLANEAALLAVRRARGTGDTRPEVRMDDFQRAMRPECDRTQRFNKLDTLLIESTAQLTEPTGNAAVRILLDGDAVEGKVVWADAHFLKIRGADADVIVPKSQIRRLEALDGTEMAENISCLENRLDAV